ncbi:hypothetical protein, partial [Escherichia coli]
MQSDKVLNLPAGYFGIVLGTIGMGGNDSNLLIVFYVQIMPDD